MGFRRTRRLSARIVLSYVAVLLGGLAVFMAGTAVVMFLQMQRQLAHYAVEDIETVGNLMFFAPDGSLKVRDDDRNHPESRQLVDRLLEVRSPGGPLLYRNQRLGARSLGSAPAAGEGVGGFSESSTALEDGTRVVRVSRRYAVDGHPVLIRLAYSEEPIFHSLWSLLGAAAVMFPVLIAAAASAGFRMSRQVLEPVQRLTMQAERINSSRLHERIPVSGTGDEIDYLAEVFNQTLARLDQSFRQLRQFTSDAAHELRTPLTAIRSVGEVGLMRDGTREEYRDLAASMIEEVNRLTGLLDQLLTISRADAGAIQMNFAVVDLPDLARQAAELLEPLAEEKGQDLVLVHDDGARVKGDPAILRQAVINVLHNAIKYSPRGGKISIRVENARPDSVAIAVEDSGPGIAPEHAARIFDRFYRVDEGRARDEGGFGLGLSIAQWAVRVHGGTIGVTSHSGTGSTFRITLPAQSCASPAAAA
jgi:heavy metal sensor kinase